MLGTHLVKARALAARTRNCSCELRRHSQQLLQHLRPQLMGSGAGGHFDRFQIEMATLAQTGGDDVQQRGYLPRRLALDCFGSFFSCGGNESSWARTGARRIRLAALFCKRRSPWRHCLFESGGTHHVFLHLLNRY